MRFICGECGKEIPDGMDFCPSCGCMSDRAYAVDDDGSRRRVCPSCGCECSDQDLFCGGCGARLSASAPVRSVPSIDGRGSIALILGTLPGFFNIFGLGHLIMKQYSRGIMFLCISLVLWYLNGWSVVNQSLFLSIVSIGVFFYHCMDLMRVVYSQGVN